jgi:hypothetical protein
LDPAVDEKKVRQVFMLAGKILAVELPRDKVQKP